MAFDGAAVDAVSCDSHCGGRQTSITIAAGMDDRRELQDARDDQCLLGRVRNEPYWRGNYCGIVPAVFRPYISTSLVCANAQGECLRMCECVTRASVLTRKERSLAGFVCVHRPTRCHTATTVYRLFAPTCRRTARTVLRLCMPMRNGDCSAMLRGNVDSMLAIPAPVTRAGFCCGRLLVPQLGAKQPCCT